MPQASLTTVKEYFGYKSLHDFSPDWKALSKEEQNQIREGIGNDTFTY